MVILKKYLFSQPLYSQYTRNPSRGKVNETLLGLFGGIMNYVQ